MGPKTSVNKWNGASVLFCIISYNMPTIYFTLNWIPVLKEDSILQIAVIKEKKSMTTLFLKMKPSYFQYIHNIVRHFNYSFFFCSQHIGFIIRLFICLKTYKIYNNDGKLVIFTNSFKLIDHMCKIYIYTNWLNTCATMVPASKAALLCQTSTSGVVWTMTKI